MLREALTNAYNNNYNSLTTSDPDYELYVPNLHTGNSFKVNLVLP